MGSTPTLPKPGDLGAPDCQLIGAAAPFEYVASIHGFAWRLQSADQLIDHLILPLLRDTIIVSVTLWLLWRRPVGFCDKVAAALTWQRAWRNSYSNVAEYPSRRGATGHVRLLNGMGNGSSLVLSVRRS
jgi:hypothetical protein